MNYDTEKRLWSVWKTTQADPEYAEMLVEIRKLEPKYENVLASLPEAEEDVIREYVIQCEAMSWRMLQIACTVMCFPEVDSK